MFDKLSLASSSHAINVVALILSLARGFAVGKHYLFEVDKNGKKSLNVTAQDKCVALGHSLANYSVFNKMKEFLFAYIKNTADHEF